MKGFGTDEQAIIAILTSSSHSQRLLIVKYLLEENNRELLEELKEELGEKFDDLTYALITTTAEYFAYEFNSLLEALDLDERALIEIVCTRSSDEIKEIINQYPKCKYEMYLFDLCAFKDPIPLINQKFYAFKVLCTNPQWPHFDSTNFKTPKP